MSDSRRIDSTAGPNDSGGHPIHCEIIPKREFISGERPLFEDAPEKTAEALRDWENEGGALNSSTKLGPGEAKGELRKHLVKSQLTKCTGSN